VKITVELEGQYDIFPNYRGAWHLVDPNQTLSVCGRMSTAGRQVITGLRRGAVFQQPNARICGYCIYQAQVGKRGRLAESAKKARSSHA
jgi:hypothetical protein